MKVKNTNVYLDYNYSLFPKGAKIILQSNTPEDYHQRTPTSSTRKSNSTYRKSIYMDVHHVMSKTQYWT